MSHSQTMAPQSDGSNRAATVGARRVELDGLRATAMLGVVVIHVCSLRLAQSPSSLARLIDTLMAFALPVFMMCSGYLHARSIASRGRSNAVLKRLRRLGTLYLIWSVIYLLHERGWSLGFPMPSANMWRIVLFGGASYHLWFLPALISVTLASSWVDTRNQRRLLVVLAFALLVIALAMKPWLLEPWAPLVGMQAGKLIARTGVKWLLPYAIGMTLVDARPTVFDRALANRSLFFACALAILVPVFAAPLNSPVASFALAWGGVAAAMLGGLLLTRRAVLALEPMATTPLAPLWPYAFGIYLIHPLLLGPLSTLVGQHLPNAVWIPLVTAVLVAASAGIVAVLRLIPFVRKSVGG